MIPDEIIINQTKKWIVDVVIGCNFCPFAAKEMKKESVQFYVVNETGKKEMLEALAKAFYYLDNNVEIETIFIIFPNGPGNFSNYLQMVDMAETLLQKEDYEAVYQLASFHPEYMFANTQKDDPANYTNRSPYPMLHLLREQSVTKAINAYPGTEKIPEKNIAFAKTKGINYMQRLLKACLQ
jgi:hypothetical protein